MNKVATSIQIEPTTLEKIRGLPWVLAMNASLAVHARFLFFGSSYVLFLNQIGFNKTQIGGLLSLLPFWGLIAIFAAPWVAQRGVKRVYLTFFGSRNIFIFMLLFSPATYLRWGTTVAFLYIAGLMSFYGLFRAIGETGHYPWQQEYIPHAIRGKFTATTNIITNIARLIAVSFAAYVVGLSANIQRFMLLFALGGIFGVGAVGAASRIPGGVPNPKVESKRPDFRGMAQSLRDRSFVSFLFGVGMLTLINLPIYSFVPLFMREKVGLSDSNVIWLQTGILLASMGTGYFWGWASDRYGSKPVILSGVIAKAVLPVAWLVMPRGTSSSFLIALAIAARWKIRGHQEMEKWPLRQGLVDTLPDEVIWRGKSKFWEGSGSGETLTNFAETAISDEEFNAERDLGDGDQLRSKEELMYYRIFKQHFGDSVPRHEIGRTQHI